MNRIQLEHIIRAASQISDDTEIVVIGSQAVHAQGMNLPPIAFHSAEADVYPRNHPERADDIDVAIGELSSFHQTHGYYAHGVSPKTRAARPGFVWTCMTLFSLNTRRPASRTGTSTKLWSDMVASAGKNSPGWCHPCRSATR